MFESLHLATLLKRFAQTQQFWLAFSGGLDSTVLLHALTKLPEKIPLRAIHINHGWHPNADQWAQQCAAFAEKLGVTCDVITVDAKAQQGKSPEAVARTARYQAFASVMQKNDCLLTAHHQDDQAETLLLQLMRGAGVKGLAAMPEISEFAHGSHLRPLLNFSRANLEQYAQENNLTWIEDDSNLNLKFDRNFIRHQLMPLLKQRWPSAPETLARAARHCAAADELLEELATKDLNSCRGERRSPAGDQPVAPTLIIKNLLQLNISQQRNVLRYWLQELNISMPSEAQLEHIQNDILHSREDADPKVSWGEVEVRRYQGELFLIKKLDSRLRGNDDQQKFAWELNQPLKLPNIGTLTATQKTGCGIRCDLITDNKVTVSFRQGGERFHPQGRQGSHPLKKLFQEWKIPTWQRDQIPLIYYEDELIAIVGYAVSEKFAAHKEILGWEIY
jgi:tRNA(Ile)-lysidine synthase